MALSSTGAWAQANASTPHPHVEEIRQREREKALRAEQEKAVDARLPGMGVAPAPRLPDQESPCFAIDRIELRGEEAERFQWLLSAAAGEGGDDNPLGRCLGTEGVNTVIARLQQALIGKGWVTSRVLAAPQDLSQGTLALTLVPGRIAAIRFADSVAEGERTSLRTAIAAQAGDLLNLRDIEQGLENFKRLPTADADIQIQPSTAAGAGPGDSDLVVQYKRVQPLGLPLRVSLSLDDSGTKATGKTQGGVTLAWDGPLGLNDLAYVNLSHDLFNHSGQGTDAQTFHYSIPYGDWLLGATASNSNYHQTVAGYSQDYVYGGETSNAEVRLSRLVHRNSNSKSTLSVRAFQRTSSNYIDDTEIETQRRVVGGWELGLNHRHFIGSATLDANVAWRQGTGAFGSLEAPEQMWGEGTSHMRLGTADVSLGVPFEMAGQRLRYGGLWRAQWNDTPLTPQDRFAIGGRYTVRGFDGETSLMGERGWLIRNDLGWAIERIGAEAYVGVDYGHVGGQSVKYLLGDSLAGAVLGLRGSFKSLSYDVFVGTPIKKPEGYRTANVTAGFSLNYSF
ncbi:ShlB/FhaC/HecB family hemolysin secretion/activation protein [Variovorax dokdonensis]